MQNITRPCSSAIGVLALLALALLASTARAADDKPSICFVTGCAGGIAEDIPLFQELRDRGFHVDDVPFHELTAQRMQQYNALIVIEFPMTDPLIEQNHSWLVRPEALPPFYEAITHYVNSGGGVVIYNTTFFQTHDNGMNNLNALLAKWGAQTLFEQVLDPDRVYQHRELFSYDYSWTENLTPHPITQGLRRVFYTTRNQHGPTTCTFKVSDDWTVLVRGEASARSVGCDTDNEFLPDKTMSYASAPPIVAVREVGKGRVAMISVSPVMAVFGARYTGYNNVLMERGNGGLNSEFGKLQERIYQWATEPAFAAKSPGGFAGAAPVYRVRPDVVGPEYDWANFKPSVYTFNPKRGIIGARTAQSGGSGSVADYVAAAEAQGLDFIAFAEDLTRYTPQSWDEFRALCKKASSEKVLAVPGLLTRDATGNRWLMLGDPEYPKPHHLSADGSQIVTNQWWILEANHGLHIPLDVTHGQRPFWTFSCYSGFPLRLYEDGKLIDEPRDAYLDRQDIGDLLCPVIVDLLSGPQQVEQAAKGRHLTGVIAEHQGKLFTTLSRSADSSALFFAAAGPSFTDLRLTNEARQTQGRFGPIPHTELMALQYRIVSDVGIKSITVLDGPDVLRRFDGGGEKQIVHAIFLPHDRQRYLMVQAEDVDGSITITGVVRARDQLQARNMCGDRCNTINAAVARTAQGRVYITGPVAPYQRKNFLFGFSPGIMDLPSRFAAPYTDGGLRPVSYSAMPEWNLVGSTPQAGAFASRMVEPLANRDVIIQQSDLIGWYDSPRSSDNAWHKALPVSEPRDVKGSVRWIDFVKRDRDMGLTLVEGSITFQRDGTLAGGLNPIIGRMFSQSTDLYNPMFSAHFADGTSFAGMTDAKNPTSINQRMKAGDFVALLPNFSGAGALFAMDDGYVVSGAMSRPTVNVMISPDLKDRQVKAGQTITYRYLCGRGVIGGERSDREWVDFARLLGMSGQPGYRYNLTQGELLSTRYIFEARAYQGGLTLELGQANLPVRLPIRVHDVNPRYSAGIVKLDDESYQPVGVIETESVAYTTWDTSQGAAKLYIGNLVGSDSPHLHITVTRPTKNWRVEVHNPTDQAVQATVRGAAAVPSLATLDQTLDVPPRQSILMDWGQR